MQKLQLYIDTTPSATNPTFQRVDLFKDETVSITQSIQNVRDIKKIFTEFTQTFTIPASKENNKIFQHYQNFNIVDGYDARNKRRAKLELNLIPFKTGFIKLEGVQLKKNQSYSYKITFFGETVNLKDLLGDADLGSLSDLDQYKLNYNSTTVKSKLSGAIGTVIAPLITHTKQLFYNSNSSAHTNDTGNLYYHTGSNHDHGVEYTDLKYAIRINTIIEAIEAEYTTANNYSSNLVFSSDFFKNTNNNAFYDLYMWLHRKKGDVQPATQISKQFAQVFAWTPLQTPNPQTASIGGGIFIPSNLVTSPNQIFNHSLTTNPTDSTIVYDVQVFRNGSLYYQDVGVSGLNTIGQSDFALTAGTWTVRIGTADPNGITFNTSTTSYIQWEIFGTIGFGFQNAWTDLWQNGFSLTTSAIFEFAITQQIPKMKIIDFLTGIFQMFNLTAFVENGVIVVKTLDSFYSSSNIVWNIDEYVDINTTNVDLALPFREIEFSYDGLGTFLAKQFEQLENTGWGSVNFSLDNAKYDAPEGNYKITLPFEHLQYQRLIDVDTEDETGIQWGWYVNDNQESYYGKPLLFYPIRQINQNDTSIPTTSPPISYRDTSSSHSALTSFIIPSNSRALSSSTSTENIHFQNEVNEYTGGSTFTGTLFENYYKTYIQNVYNNKRRLTKVKANLPLKMIYNLKLNDKISLNNKTYQINSVKTDLTTGKSDLELLNVV
mgnify:CR=1 FL=1